MAYNMYKQIDKIKESLKTKGYEKEIPFEVFGRELMLMFGMKKTDLLSRCSLEDLLNESFYAGNSIF